MVFVFLSGVVHRRELLNAFCEPFSAGASEQAVHVLRDPVRHEKGG